MLRPGLQVIIVLSTLSWALAYIPAVPTNSTNAAIDAGLNVTDVSKLILRWYSDGTYMQNVSYQIVGTNSSGISKGALVHFSENKVVMDITTTPWIALVACDFNGTVSSEENDIFTLARDRGAVAAVLYSLYSAACIINPQYANPANFDQVFDIFSTQSITSAHLIEYQFGQFGPVNQSIYGSYDPQKLNDSAADVNSYIQKNMPPAPGYLYATLRAYNATGGTDPNTGSAAPNSGSSSSGSPTNTGLAMIILYSITGCVSALFVLVIISGAIRAVRHPERYGPRTDGYGAQVAQSRARGLTRAILDTFPVVKFGAQADGAATGRPSADKDPEGRPSSRLPSGTSPQNGVELSEWELMDVPRSSVISPTSPSPAPPGLTETTTGSTPHSEGATSSTSQPTSVEASASSSRPRNKSRKASSSEDDKVVPAAIGRETCPICIVDFEEGDDLRVLPCEGNHRFHQTCVDPWLLELSSSCPICRQDFLALETILSRGSDDGHARSSFYLQTPTQQNNRFSRYIRFARRRNRDQVEYDPTDPPMPTAIDA